MANKQNKENAIVTFLTAKTLKIDKQKGNVVARKNDSKDVNKDAKRHASFSIKQSSALNDFIETTKTKMFNEVKTLANVFIGKDFIANYFVTSNEMDTNFPFIDSTMKKQKADFKIDISRDDYLKALKICFENHISQTAKTRENALANLSTNAKLVITGKENDTLDKAIKAYNEKVAKQAKVKVKAVAA